MNQRKQAKRAWMDVLAGYREKSAKAGSVIENGVIYMIMDK